MHRILTSLTILLATVFTLSASADVKTSLRNLDNVLQQRDKYYSRHEAKIDSIKKLLASVPAADTQRRSALLHDIFVCYRSFQGDSAAAIADRELELAQTTGDRDRILLAECDRLFSFISKGNFTDAVLLVKDIDLAGTSPYARGEFYFLCNRLYNDIHNYTRGSVGDKNSQLSAAYADSVIATLPADNYKSQYSKLFLRLSKINVKEKIKLFSRLLDRKDIDNDEKAKIASYLADLYYEDGQKEVAVDYKTRASIMDITEGKRETFAMQTLADWMFQAGDFERASGYINMALDDANFFNAPHRKAQIANMLPLIESARYNIVDSERRTLWITISIMVALMVALAITVGLNVRAKRKLRASSDELARQQNELRNSNTELARTNQLYEETNSRLQKTLERYKDSVKIKDEYIANFFFSNSQFILKIDDIYKTVRKKLLAHQYDDLLKNMSDSDIKQEQQKMLNEFDKMFLRLFPNFVKQYAALFPKDDPGVAPSLTQGYSLTPEMRIFALIRLGITDTARIATFLNYSSSTVSTYKTRVKNRSTVANEHFEEAIAEIR